MLIIGLYSSIILPVCLAYLIFLLNSNIRFVRRIKLSGIWLLLLSFLGGLFLVNSFHRIGFLSSLSLLTSLLTIVIFLSRSVPLQNKIINQLVGFIILGSTLNTFLYIAFGDFSGNFNGYASLAGLLGYQLERPLFYFSNGVNHYGVILGFCLVLVFCWYRDLSGSFSSLIGIFLKGWVVVHLLLLIFIIDSRGAVLGVFGAYFGSKLFGFSRIYNYLLLLIPILIPLIGILILFIVTSSVPFMRDGSTLFSHRESVWMIGISGLGELPTTKLIFGSGASGYMNYSFGEEIASFFSNRDNNVGSLHNAYLQLIYEFGLFGIFLFVASYVWVLRRLATRNLLFRLSPLFSYFFIVSATEAILSLGYFFILISLGCYSLLTINQHNRLARSL